MEEQEGLEVVEEEEVQVGLVVKTHMGMHTEDHRAAMEIKVAMGNWAEQANLV